MKIGLSMRKPQGLTATQRAISLLRRLGTNAHVWLPGVGSLNGLQTANYLLSDASTGLAPVDQPVGRVNDALGSVGSALTAANMLASLGNVISDLGGGLFKLTMNGADPFVEFQFTNQGALGGRAHKIEFDVWTDSGQPTELNIVTYDNTVGDGLFTTFVIGFAPGARQTIKRWITPNTNTGFSVRFDGKDPLVAGSYFYFKVPDVREVTGIHATQPTTANKPVLRRGAVNLLTYSGDFSNAAWDKFNGAVITQGVSPPVGISFSQDVTCAGTLGSYLEGTLYATTTKTFTGAVWVKGVGTSIGKSSDLFVLRDGYAEYFNTSVVLTSAWQLVVLPVTFTGSVSKVRLRVDPHRATSTNGEVVSIAAAALFQGTYTAAQIQALGGIPLTTTAPVSTALGTWWWDTTGGKSLSATFPSGYEAVTVVDAVKTGQVTQTAQNVVGTYNITTPTHGRFVIKAAITAPELTLLQKLANSLAGL